MGFLSRSLLEALYEAQQLAGMGIPLSSDTILSASREGGLFNRIRRNLLLGNIGAPPTSNFDAQNIYSPDILLASKRQGVLKRKGTRRHRKNVLDAIRRGLLQGNERLEILNTPEIKGFMQDWYRRNYGRFIRQAT